MKKGNIRILIVDQLQLFREAVARCLTKEVNIEIVGETDNGTDALLLIEQRKPDIVLMGISLVGMNGLETADLIKATGLKTKVVILSMQDHSHYVSTALALNILGYVRKQEALHCLIAAIFSVIQGKRYYSESLDINTAKPFKLPLKIKRTLSNQLLKLTKRETEMVTLVAKGLSNQEIALLSFLSIKTVETHRSNINRKLHTHNGSDVTRYAIRQGLITP